MPGRQGCKVFRVEGAASMTGMGFGLFNIQGPCWWVQWVSEDDADDANADRDSQETCN